MKPVIQTNALSKTYHGKAVVKNLDLSVPEGSIYGFLGPNGAGKSTTMKMLLGLTKPSAGYAAILGKTVCDGNRLEILKQTGSLIESPSYYAHLTGRENLTLIASLKQVSPAHVDEVLATVHLTDDQHKKAGHYSLGMKQRLGLAAALLGHPKLLLLDEPTNGLDPAGIQEMRSLICSLPSRYGMTVLVSSHLLAEIDQMATHVGIIDRGELIFQDQLSVLHENSRPDLILRTTDDESALLLLQGGGYPVSVKDRQLHLGSISDSSLLAAQRILYSNGIWILRLSELQRSLEDIFLDLTGRHLSHQTKTNRRLL